MRAIYILWLRQLKRALRSKSRVVGALGQPLLFLVALGFGFGPIYKKAGGGDYIQFLTPGVIAMSILFTAVFSGIEIIWDRQFGFLKETLVAPVSRLQIVLGRTLGGATVAVLQGFIVWAVCLAIGFRVERPWLIPVALGFMGLISLAFTAVGTAIGSTLEDMQAFPLIMNFLVMPLFFFSSALFPLDNLPAVLRVASRLNPLTYGVDGLRGAMSGAPAYGLALDGLVLGLSTAALLGLGSWLFSRIEL